MKKVLLLIGIIFIASVLYLWTQRVTLVTHLLSQSTHLDIRLDDIVLTRQGIEMRNLRILGLPGASTIKALSAQRAVVSLNPLNLFRDPIAIHSVALYQVNIGLELFSWDGTDNNWARLLNRVDRSDKTVLTSVTPKARGWTLGHFEANQIRITVKNRVLTALSKDLPAIPKVELDNIGSAHPLPLKPTLQLLLKAVLEPDYSPKGLRNLFERSVKSP